MGGRGKSSGGKASVGESITSAQMNLLKISKYGDMMTNASSSDHAEGAKNGLTSDETDLIFSYTNETYVDFNSNLRSGDPGVTQFMKDKMNVALNKMPAYKGTTYRNIEVANPKAFVSSITSKNFKFNDFVSTTTDRSQLSNFSGNITFEIKSKRGRNVAKLSAQKSEKEILFKAGSKFKFTSSSTKKGHTTIKIEEL